MALWFLATDVGGSQGHESCLTLEHYWGWILLVCGKLLALVDFLFLVSDLGVNLWLRMIFTGA